MGSIYLSVFAFLAKPIYQPITDTLAILITDTYWLLIYPSIYVQGYKIAQKFFCSYVIPKECIKEIC